jgi:hypothetical protein
VQTKHLYHKHHFKKDWKGIVDGRLNRRVGEVVTIIPECKFILQLW